MKDLNVAFWAMRLSEKGLNQFLNWGGLEFRIFERIAFLQLNFMVSYSTYMCTTKIQFCLFALFLINIIILHSQQYAKIAHEGTPDCDDTLQKIPVIHTKIMSNVLSYTYLLS